MWEMMQAGAKIGWYLRIAKRIGHSSSCCYGGGTHHLLRVLVAGSLGAGSLFIDEIFRESLLTSCSSDACKSESS